MKKYRITFYYEGVPAPCIQEIEVEKETDASVWVNGSRRAKRSMTEAYFGTWDEAYDYLLHVANLRIEDARKNVERYEQILAMRKPEDAE